MSRPHVCFVSTNFALRSTVFQAVSRWSSAITGRVHEQSARAKSRGNEQTPAVIRTLQWKRIPCRVVDKSADGANIEASAGVTIPELFKLLIPNDLFEAECEVRHADEVSAGLLLTSHQIEALAAHG